MPRHRVKSEIRMAILDGETVVHYDDLMIVIEAMKNSLESDFPSKASILAGLLLALQTCKEDFEKK